MALLVVLFMVLFFFTGSYCTVERLLREISLATVKGDCAPSTTGGSGWCVHGELRGALAAHNSVVNTFVSRSARVLACGIFLSFGSQVYPSALQTDCVLETLVPLRCTAPP
jgi:hypothetical protein